MDVFCLLIKNKLKGGESSMSRSLTIADDAYAALKDHKKDGESFSDVVRKLSNPVAKTRTVRKKA